MYIIELFIKLKKDINYIFSQKGTISKNEQIETCNHFFVPIDSTKKILACSKCGEIYKLKNDEKNPFE